jgi:glycosyltransferase involved in cell wall biosynthesis
MFGKRVLFYFGGFAPVGGIETFAGSLLSELQLINYECVLLCWGGDSTLLDTIKRANVRTIRTFWRWGCRWRLPDWMLLPLGLRYVRHADAILFGKLLPAKIIKLIKARARKSTPLVFVTPYKPLLPATASGRRLMLGQLNLFDAVIVQSADFAAPLREIGYEKKIAIIPYVPQRLGDLEPFPPQESFKIGFLGRLVEDKNVPLLLEGFKRFSKSHLGKSESRSSKKQSPSLHVFGDGQLRNDLERLAQTLEVSHLVHFHGSIDRKEVAEAIASCHLFAFTSRHEGQCLAALEILSCGRPVVATDAGAFPEILSDDALGKLFTSATAEGVANCFTEMEARIREHSITPESVKARYRIRYDPAMIVEKYDAFFDTLKAAPIS